MTTNILLLCPLKGNGGICSWSNSFISSFPDDQYHLYPIDIAPDKPSTYFHGIDSWFYGIKGVLRARKGIRLVLRNHLQIKMMHITTSGGNGVFRDYVLGRICKKKGLKIIVHCHFGSVSELYQNRGWKGMCFRNVLATYDQIWVLDRQSESFLSSQQGLKGKVFLTPNPINVPKTCDFSPKSYRRIGFVGNILPSKGIFELMEAVMLLNDDTKLFIAGEGSEENIHKVKVLTESKRGKNINFLGCLTNQDAVKLIESLDILALPTYYDLEAFPISILEAMSRGKMIISCPRAAIPDMLTTSDEVICGILVPEKSSQAIADAIGWCQQHPDEADLICKKAYEKVYSTYRKEVIYDIYRNNYYKAISGE